jgi:IS66 C-terminal element
MLYSLFATPKKRGKLCKIHNANPIEWLTYVVKNINTHKVNAIEELLPLQNYAA